MAIQEPVDLGRNHAGNTCIGLGRQAGDVGRQHEIGDTSRDCTGQRRASGQGFDSENVDGGTTELATDQCIGKGGFVDDAAARGIDEDRAFLHLRQARRIEQVARAGFQRHMQRHHVGAGEQGFE